MELAPAIFINIDERLRTCPIHFIYQQSYSKDMVYETDKFETLEIVVLRSLLS